MSRMKRLLAWWRDRAARPPKPCHADEDRRWSAW